MKTSEQVDQIDAALAKAQEEMPHAVLNRVNPHFKNQYADLAAIRDATRVLAKHGIAVYQAPTLLTWENGSQFVLITRLSHKGQWVECDWPLTIGTPQSMGSGLTYARRYSLSSLAGIAADEDDDAEVAEYTEQQGIKAEQRVAKKSAYRARKDGDWPAIQAEMDAIKDAHTLRLWAVSNSERLHSLPDNWLVHFREEYERRLTMMKEGVDETGADIKTMLERSLQEEGREDGGDDDAA